MGCAKCIPCFFLLPFANNCIRVDTQILESYIFIDMMVWDIVNVLLIVGKNIMVYKDSVIFA